MRSPHLDIKHPSAALGERAGAGHRRADRQGRRGGHVEGAAARRERHAPVGAERSRAGGLQDALGGGRAQGELAGHEGGGDGSEIGLRGDLQRTVADGEDPGEGAAVVTRKRPGTDAVLEERQRAGDLAADHAGAGATDDEGPGARAGEGDGARDVQQAGVGSEARPMGDVRTCVHGEISRPRVVAGGIAQRGVTRGGGGRLEVEGLAGDRDAALQS